MKRTTICVAAALVAALAAGMMAGCSSQPASSASGSGSESASAASASSESASASSASAESASAESASAESSSAASEQATDEVLAELKDVGSKMPAFKSVTITEQSLTTATGAAAESSEAASSESAAAESSEAASSESAAAESSEAAESDSISATTVYKFDESGDKVRTSMTCQIDDITLQYFTEGDDAVCVSDGPVYSGTVEQFNLTHAAGAAAYLQSATGELNTVFDCVDTVKKSQQDGMTVYEMTLDPAKRIASDEIYQLMADNGDPLLAESIILGFDENGYLVWANEKREFKDVVAEKNIMLSDFDNTVVDPMPEADKTFEDMQADMDEKYAAIFAELDKADGVEGEASSEAAEAK